MLVRWLTQRQEAEGLSDVAFARKLGVSQPMWNRIRNGHNRPTWRLIQKAILVYPKDRDTIIDLALASGDQVEPSDEAVEVA